MKILSLFFDPYLLFINKNRIKKLRIGDIMAALIKWERIIPLKLRDKKTMPFHLFLSWIIIYDPSKINGNKVNINAEPIEELTKTVKKRNGDHKYTKDETTAAILCLKIFLHSAYIENPLPR